MSTSNGENRWVCPNDRVLTLRAKLMSGWSVRSGSPTTPPFGPNLTSTSSTTSSSTYSNSGSGGSSANGGCSSHISEAEQEAIRNVIKRAQLAELTEKERIDRLIDRLNNMKRNAAGDGRTRCALCNEKFHMFGTQWHHCKDCEKAVCSKCGVDTTTPDNETIWFCKICSETREMWKKSGAWFLGTLPTFTLTSPSSGSVASRNQSPSLTSSLTSLYSSDIQLQPLPIVSPTRPDYQQHHYQSNQSLQQHQPAKVQNSTKILSASPVIRRKTRSPSPRNHRPAAFPFNANELSANSESAKEVYNEAAWDHPQPGNGSSSGYYKN